MGEDYITNRNTRELSPGRIARVRVMVERATGEKPAFGTSRGSSQQPCPQAGGAGPGSSLWQAGALRLQQTCVFVLRLGVGP